MTLFERGLSGYSEGQFSRNSLLPKILLVGLNTQLGFLHQLNTLLPQIIYFEVQLIYLLGVLSTYLHRRLIFFGEELLVLFLQHLNIVFFICILRFNHTHFLFSFSKHFFSLVLALVRLFHFQLCILCRVSQVIALVLPLSQNFLQV